MLAESFRILAQDSRFYLLVVGDGNEMKTLRKLEQEFPDRVKLTGNLPHDRVPSYIHGIDIAVAPYPDLQPFYFSPLKILEYMACGKAVIASSAGQINQMIDHGETGWLIPPGDRDAFVNAIRHLAGDANLRKRMGQKAADVARKEHCWKKRVEYIFNLIDDQTR
jgi:glycosyltransferase involved in cell wall biosynthesis